MRKPLRAWIDVGHERGVSMGGRSEKLELKSPMLVNGMLVEKEQKYLII